MEWTKSEKELIKSLYELNTLQLDMNSSIQKSTN